MSEEGQEIVQPDPEEDARAKVIAEITTIEDRNTRLARIMDLFAKERDAENRFLDSDSTDVVANKEADGLRRTLEGVAKVKPKDVVDATVRMLARPKTGEVSGPSTPPTPPSAQ